MARTAQTAQTVQMARPGAPARHVFGMALCLVLLATGSPARSETLVADLSQRLIAITTGFAGTDVLLFGATDGEGDVIVVVRGPDRPVTMHRKSRVVAIWVNTATMVFDDVPSFFAVAASKPIEEIASEAVRDRNKMDIESLISLPPAKASPNVAEEWKQALIRNKQREGLYQARLGRVSFSGPRLFRSDVYFPANVPTGNYQIQVYLLRDGRVISAQTTPLIIGKIGLEADIFDFAHKHAAFYGLIAIALALLAGWLAHVAFRRA